jgi:pimeloyl-ACP methyl ester carboxylesterase
MIAIYIISVLFILWLIGNSFTFLLQDYFIFRPTRLRENFEFNFPIQFEELMLDSVDDGKINTLWFRDPNRKKPLVLYFHGNSGDLSKWGHLGQYFKELGYDLLIYDYRGFGKSKGKRNEALFHADARVMYDLALKHYATTEIVLFGRSMGTGITCKLASEVDAKCTILETPYHSIKDLFKSYYPFLPPFLFKFKYRFNSHHYLPFCKSPAYILQGDRDRVIPYRCAERLKPFLPKSSHFITIKGGKHNNLAQFHNYSETLRNILAKNATK